MSDTTGANMLGAVSPLPGSPSEALLECVPYHQSLSMTVRLSVPEFTSICPKTGQPDFAHIVVDYMPSNRLVESKAFKLFMGSFRNHGAFHEDTTAIIYNRLFEAMHPSWLRVSAYWFPRGGIPIDVFIQSEVQPSWAHLPPIDIPVYRAR